MASDGSRNPSGTGSGLTNVYVDWLISKLSSSFIGVYADIPTIIHQMPRFSLVCNVGYHFVAIIGFPDRLIYMDPLGMQPLCSWALKFLQEDHRPHLVNAVTFQHPLSLFCGFYCAFFILFYESSNHGILQPFQFDDLSQNDVTVITNLEIMIGTNADVWLHKQSTFAAQ
jgi:hypothetical protein